jgi:hypothetical protein
MSLTALHQIDTATGLVHVDLEEGERLVLANLAEQVALEAAGAPDNLSQLTAEATKSLPSRLLELGEEVAAWPPPGSGWMIEGLPIDERGLGNTPESWRHSPDDPTPEDCQLLLLGWALGTVFAWADQQGGAPVHNIIPVAGDEESLLSSSSTLPLALHTEDAFFAERADLLLLLCLRNPSQAATYISDVRNVVLSEQDARLLQDNHYFFKPDGSHSQRRPQRNSGGFPVVSASTGQAAGPYALMGLVDVDPWLRCDIDYIEANGNERAMEAARALDRALRRARAELVLRPGQLLVIDNRCCVHGRGRFRPTYSGLDRWLKRVSVSTQECESTTNRPFRKAF